MSTAPMISASEAHGARNVSSGSSRPIGVRTDDPDAALVRAAQNGDYSAFDELVTRHERTAFRLAQNITRNRENAEDVVQDSFVNAFLHLDRFHGDARFSTWLTRIVINQALMLLRKRTNKLQSLDQENDSQDNFAPREITDWGPTPEQRYSQLELREILAQVMGRLSPALRIVFQLRDVEELSTEETAQILGISVTAVKSRLLRARLWLRERLNHYFRLRSGDSGRNSRARFAAYLNESGAMGGAS